MIWSITRMVKFHSTYSLVVQLTIENIYRYRRGVDEEKGNGGGKERV
jgi:hypothetical protein